MNWTLFNHNLFKKSNTYFFLHILPAPLCTITITQVASSCFIVVAHSTIIAQKV